MLNFGTSAYLKLLALNPKPRDTEIRKRLSADGKGYDFHKAMRRIARTHAAGSISWEQAQTELQSIRKVPEGNAAIAAVENFAKWVGKRHITSLSNNEHRSISPSELFSVIFTPDFEIELNDSKIRVHIWNTAQPTINLREAVGTLGLFAHTDDAFRIGILSLGSGELFAIADADQSRELAMLLARDIDQRILRLRAETADRRRGERPDDRVH